MGCLSLWKFRTINQKIKKDLTVLDKQPYLQENRTTFYDKKESISPTLNKLGAFRNLN